MSDPSAAHSLLREERQRLAEQIASLTRAHDDIVEASVLVAVDDEHDPEGATIAFERAQVAALLRDERVLLAATDAALLRLAQGAYGNCSRCGGAISAERLAALPATPTCIACAH